MTLGVAGTIRTVWINSTKSRCIDSQVNDWLEDNSDLEILDIKFSTTEIPNRFTADALIIYRKEK